MLAKVQHISILKRHLSIMLDWKKAKVSNTHGFTDKQLRIDRLFIGMAGLPCFG
jgi:hypothetical protein